MGKLFNIYDKNKMDRTWYQSSNIKYSECDDNVDALKTVRIVFADGRTYQYENVNVHDYLHFREDLSQGKAMNKYLKQYESSRLDNTDLVIIEKEMKELMEQTDFIIDHDSDMFTITNQDKEIVFQETIENIEKEPLQNILKIINNLNLKIQYNAK